MKKENIEYTQTITASCALITGMYVIINHVTTGNIVGTISLATLTGLFAIGFGITTCYKHNKEQGNNSQNNQENNNQVIIVEEVDLPEKEKKFSAKYTQEKEQKEMTIV